MDPARRPDPLTLAAFAGFVLLAGTNGTAIAFSNRELAPFWGGALRFLAASALFLVLALFTRRPFPRGRALVGVVLYGVLGFGATFALIYWALETVKPGLTQVVLALAPMLTLLLAVFQGLEAFRWRVLAGALACLAGIAYIFHGQFSTALQVGPILALLGAALCIAEATVVAKRFPKADLVTTNVVAMGVAGVLLLALSLAVGETRGLPTKAATWEALAFLVLGGTVAAYALFLVVVQRWTASAAAYQWVLLPLVAVPLSAHFTGEAVTWDLLVGGAVVVAGVYIGAIWRPRPKEA